MRIVSVKRSVKSKDRRQRATEGPKASSRVAGQDIVCDLYGVGGRGGEGDGGYMGWWGHVGLEDWHVGWKAWEWVVDSTVFGMDIIIGLL